MFCAEVRLNELQAQIETYLPTLPTENCRGGEDLAHLRPQIQNAMRRLLRVLERNLLTRYLWSRSGYIYKVGQPDSSSHLARHLQRGRRHSQHAVGMRQAQDADEQTRQDVAMAAPRMRRLLGHCLTSHPATELQLAKAELADLPPPGLVLTADDVLEKKSQPMENLLTSKKLVVTIHRARNFSAKRSTQKGMLPPPRIDGRPPHPHGCPASNGVTPVVRRGREDERRR
jgi:hypothetical protein